MRHSIIPFNPKRPGGLVGVIVSVSECLRALYVGIAESRNDGSHGPCAACSGTATPAEIDPDRMIAPELSLNNGAVLLWAGTDCAPVKRIRQLAAVHGIDHRVPLEEQDPGFISVLLYGDDKHPVWFVHNRRPYTDYYRGCVNDLQSMIDARTASKGNLRMISFFSKPIACPSCGGTRMSDGDPKLLLAGYTLDEARKLPIRRLLEYIESLPRTMDANEFDIVSPIIGNLKPMLVYLRKIGLRTLQR